MIPRKAEYHPARSGFKADPRHAVTLQGLLLKLGMHPHRTPKVGYCLFLGPLMLHLVDDESMRDVLGRFFIEQCNIESRALPHILLGFRRKPLKIGGLRSNEGNPYLIDQGGLFKPGETLEEQSGF